MLTKIGVIGDIHGESFLLEIALKFFEVININHILTVGDILDGEGNIDHCCELLQKYQVMAVKGNHERWFLNNHLRQLKNATQLTDINKNSYQYLANLPATKVLETPEGLLLLCHGLDTDDMIKLNPDDYGYAIESNLPLQNLINDQKYRFVINGHTHLRMVRKFENLTIINAGSLKAKSNYNRKPCFLIVDFVKKIVEYYEFTEAEEKHIFLAETLIFD